MSSSRPFTTRSIKDLLTAKNIEIAGVQKKTIGTYEVLTGLGTLTAVGIHILATQPHFAAAHIILTSLGTFLTIDGIFNKQSGDAQVELGQAITEQTLKQPEAAYSAQSSVLFFSSDTPPAYVPVNTPVIDTEEANRLKTG